MHVENIHVHVILQVVKLLIIPLNYVHVFSDYPTDLMHVATIQQNIWWILGVLWLEEYQTFNVVYNLYS